jgi:hypothetical protein
MGNYACPFCTKDVPPVALGRVAGGEIDHRTDEGLLIERRRCPTCGERVERTVVDYWQPAGQLAADRASLITLR